MSEWVTLRCKDQRVNGSNDIKSVRNVYRPFNPLMLELYRQYSLNFKEQTNNVSMEEDTIAH